MEVRIKKYRQLSPGRAKVWTEKSPKYYYNPKKPEQQRVQKVPVVYYLCSNRQLEHPHFMEVPLSSPDGILLRDVIERLNSLRGRGMASKYSWSCKRSYKSGYVWHDLCEDDLILPAHGNEYVLKGSELLEEPCSGRFSHAGALTLQKKEALPEPLSTRIRDESSSSSNLNNGRITRSPHADYHLSPLAHHSCSSAASPGSSIGKNLSLNSSLRFANASTQTEGVVEVQDPCIKPDSSMKHHHQTSEICGDFTSPPLSTSSESFPSDRASTLESLIQADIRKLKSLKKTLEVEGSPVPSTMKLKPLNLIIQLISCGSIYVKDQNFDMIPSYKHSFAHCGEMDYPDENRCQMGLTVEDKVYFSGSLDETTMTENHSSSFHADRRTIQVDTVKDRQDLRSLSEQPRGRQNINACTSTGGSIRMSEMLAAESQSRRHGSFRNIQENVTNIEESWGILTVNREIGCNWTGKIRWFSSHRFSKSG